MTQRRAGFTLIELLVVIAIIAILAGLIFPVFAQAKIAAMKTTSLSNVKQITLGSLMYATDVDDGLPIYANGSVYDVGKPAPRVDTWVWTTQPYIKNMGVMIDPLMGDPHHLFGQNSGEYWLQSIYPDYGVNYVFLAPYKKNPKTGLCTESGSVTTSGASHPSSTIFYTTSFHPNLDESYAPSGGYADCGSWVVTAPAMLSILKNDATYCVWPGMDWAKHPVGFNDGKPFPAEVAARYSNGSVTAMLDGHAQYLKLDQMAAGTDWDTAAFQHTKITHASKYLWDYDGTFFGTTVPQ